MAVWDGVVPLAGTWIEMDYIPLRRQILPVVPLAGTWIEILEEAKKRYPEWYVVPLAGTWIEIGRWTKVEDRTLVVPLAGTWIEIHLVSLKNKGFASFPSRERGLKCLEKSRTRYVVVKHFCNTCG